MKFSMLDHCALGRLGTDNSAVSNNDEEFVNDFNEANQNTSQLEFESRFECGNLRKAIHTGKFKRMAKL